MILCWTKRRSQSALLWFGWADRLNRSCSFQILSSEVRLGSWTRFSVSAVKLTKQSLFEQRVLQLETLNLWNTWTLNTHIFCVIQGSFQIPFHLVTERKPGLIKRVFYTGYLELHGLTIKAAIIHVFILMDQMDYY